MAASTYDVARNLFEWARGDEVRIGQINAAFDAAVTGGALAKGGLNSIGSGTKNGVTAQMVIGLPENDRITALRLVKGWLAQGFCPGRRSRAVF
jgi:hypothetical protein